MQLRRRIPAGPDVELLWLDNPLSGGRTPELKFIFSQLELDGLFRTCYQAHSLEALQLFHRPRCAAGTLVDIKLYYGVTGPGLLTLGRVSTDDLSGKLQAHVGEDAHRMSTRI